MGKENCKNLYQRYQELKEKTKLKIHRLDDEDVKAVEPHNISSQELQDLEDLEKTKAALEDCLEFLNDEDLIELSDDDDIGKKAQEILMKRSGR